MGKSYKMVRIVLSVFVSLLFLELATAGIEKHCYECENRDGFDSCGKFDDSTDKCSVEKGGYCIRATSNGGNGGSLGKEYGCDGINICTENGCKNTTIDEEPMEVCCCDGNLCNSGSFKTTKVTGKQCYECGKYSNGVLGETDNCGNFDSDTPKCNLLNETVSCIISVATVDGNYARLHGCDNGRNLCDGVDNECVYQLFNGVTAQICCCDGNLCNTPDLLPPTTTTTEPSNSGSFLSSSVSVFLSALLAKWFL